MARKYTANHEKASAANVFKRKPLSVRPSRHPSVRDDELPPKRSKQRRASGNLGSDLLAYPANNLSAARPASNASSALNTYAPYLFHPKEPRP